MTIEVITNDAVNAAQTFLQSHDVELNPESDVKVSETSKKTEIKILVPKGLRTELANVILPVVQSNSEVEPSVVRSSGGEIIGYKGKVDGRIVAVYFKPGGSGAATVTNKGDVAEGILGAAVTARFIRRDGKEVTESDVNQILHKLDAKNDTAESPKQTAKAIEFKVHDVNKKIKDTVLYDVRLSAGNFADLVDKKKRTSINDIVKAAVAYANSGEVIDQSIEWSLNNKANKVHVLSDGVSDQKGTKVDVRIFEDGQEISIGKISLKAGGTKQLGQIGKSFESLESMFGILFGIQFTPAVKNVWEKAFEGGPNKEAVEQAAKKVYQYAYKQLKKKLANPENEVEFMKQFAQGVKYQAVLEEDGVRLIHLERGKFKILDFDRLESALDNVDLDVVLDLKGITPKLFIVDVNTGSKLLQIRMKTEGGGKTVRHYVEKEKLLVDLLNVVSPTVKKEEYQSIYESTRRAFFGK
jgi:hypothetical protein